MLLGHSTRKALALWRAYGRCYEGTLVIKRGPIDSGLWLLRPGFAELGDSQSAILRLVKLQAAESLGHAGRVTDGLAAVEEVIDHWEHSDEHWLIAELLHIRGDLLILLGADVDA